MIEKIERPKVVKTNVERVPTGCGNLYIRVGYLDGRKPIEIIATLGKTGGCSRAQNEALTRSITLGLKYGIPVKEFVEELENIECPGRYMWPKSDRVLSCADGIAKVLRGYVEGGHSKT